jgi:hypothetical protein
MFLYPSTAGELDQLGILINLLINHSLNFDSHNVYVDTIRSIHLQYS